MEMTIEDWQKFIDNNFNSDKLEVLFKMAVENDITYTKFKELLKYVQEKK